MKKISSSSTGISSGSSRGRGGIPRKCWCGQHMVKQTSKTDANPYRRYYRCAFAAMEKLVDDDHVFKWIDEATIQEIENVAFKTMKLEEEIEEIKKIITETMEVRNNMFQKIERELDGKMEIVLMECKWSMKKMVLVVLAIEFLLICGFLKLVA